MKHLNMVKGLSNSTLILVAKDALERIRSNAGSEEVYLMNQVNLALSALGELTGSKSVTGSTGRGMDGE